MTLMRFDDDYDDGDGVNYVRYTYTLRYNNVSRALV
jgi:hypothetical protein